MISDEGDSRNQFPKKLIIFFAAKDGEALYSQQKQDQELIVAQTMNFLLPNSDLPREKHLGEQKAGIPAQRGRKATLPS